MKFSVSVHINASRETVVRYFKDESLLHHYQDGFLRVEHVLGTPSTVGSIKNMYYKYGKGEMEITETILENNLPDSFFGQYHHIHMDNTMLCTFFENKDGGTTYQSDVEYTEIRSFLPKLMAFVFPSLFKKQVLKWMENFKRFVESQV